MYDMIAWYAIQACNGLTLVAALADPVHTVVGNNVSVPRLNKLGWAYARNNSMVTAQLRCPELQKLGFLQISPVEETARVPIVRGLFTMDMIDNPIQLVSTEQMTAMVDNGNVNAYNFVVVQFMDEKTPIPPGPRMTIRLCGTQACVAGVWSNGAIVPATALPAGRYGVIGFKFCSTSLVAARLVYGDIPERPGTVGFPTEATPVNKRFRHGNAGLMGEFEHDRIPTVDLLCIAADAAQTVILDLVQIRAGPAT